MASWLVRSSSDRAVRVRVLAGDIVLCSLARRFQSHRASLHQGTGELNAGGKPAMVNQGGVELSLVASCYRNRDKHRPDGPLGSYTDFTYGRLTENRGSLATERAKLYVPGLWCRLMYDVV